MAIKLTSGWYAINDSKTYHHIDNQTVKKQPITTCNIDVKKIYFTWPDDFMFCEDCRMTISHRRIVSHHKIK